MFLYVFAQFQLILPFFLFILFHLELVKAVSHHRKKKLSKQAFLKFHNDLDVYRYT